MDAKGVHATFAFACVAGIGYDAVFGYIVFFMESIAVGGIFPHVMSHFSD